MRLSLQAVFLVLPCLFSFSGCSTNENEFPLHPANNLPVGASRSDFLLDNNYDKLVIEIQYTNEGPDQKAIDRLEDFLTDYLFKSQGIEIHSEKISLPEKEKLSLNDIKAIELNNRTEYTEGRTIAAYFFFADAQYVEQGKETTLCLPYKNTSMAIFTDPLRNGSGSGRFDSRIISTLMIHVMGHNLGSTNEDGTPNTNYGCPQHKGG